jgi:hypothetical protein
MQDRKLALQAPIGCSNVANNQEPTKLGLAVGATITVETALQALIMKSANDVAVMLAEAVSEPHEAFVDYMSGMAGFFRVVYRPAQRCFCVFHGYFEVCATPDWQYGSRNAV